MKRPVLTCWFEDGTHAKLAVEATDSLHAVLLQVARKRELAVAEDFALFDVAGHELDLATHIGDLSSDSVWLKQRKSEASSSSLPYCSFCGMDGEGLVNAGAQFGSYHPYCFKCVHCFAACQPGDKLFPHPNKRAIVCEKCINVLREAKLCRCGESVRGELVAHVGDEFVHVECLLCNICDVTLFGCATYVAKDGAFLCAEHGSFKPVEKKVVRPKLRGAWAVGDACIAKHGPVWGIGHVESLINNVAVVSFGGDDRAAVTLFDLRVASVARHDVAAAKRDLFRRSGHHGSVADMPVLRKVNTLAQFMVVPDAGGGGAATAQRARPSPAGLAPRTPVGSRRASARIGSARAVAADGAASEGALTESGGASRSPRSSRAAPTPEPEPDADTTLVRSPRTSRVAPRPPPPRLPRTSAAATAQVDADAEAKVSPAPSPRLLSRNSARASDEPTPAAAADVAFVAPVETSFVAPPSASMSALRFQDGEAVLALDNQGIWRSGIVLGGDLSPELRGPFYLISVDGSDEDMAAHENEIRRRPQYAVGSHVEARWVEDDAYYPSVVEEHAGDVYVVRFDVYDNLQQCTLDFLRPIPGTECAVCGGPPQMDERGDCYFCGAPRPPCESAPPSVPDTEVNSAVVVASADAPADVALVVSPAESLEASSLSLSTSASTDEVRVLERENARLLADSSATHAALDAARAELAELRERLAVTQEANMRLTLEMETLRSAAMKARVRSATKSRMAKPLPAAPARALPKLPPPFVRQSSGAALGAGRGKRIE